jgi:hypothetical protein
MAEGKWGHCHNCTYFGSPARAPLVNEEAACRHPDMARYGLSVFGASGCTLFELRMGISEQVEEPPYVVSA